MKDADKRKVREEFREMVCLWVEQNPVSAADTLIARCGANFLVYDESAEKQAADDIKATADEANAAAIAAEIRDRSEWEARLAEHYGIDMRDPKNWKKGDVLRWNGVFGTYFNRGYEWHVTDGSYPTTWVLIGSMTEIVPTKEVTWISRP